MSEHLSNRTLLVVSDTAFFKEGGKLFAFEPVVRELNALSPSFDKIIWLGSLVNSKKTAVTDAYNSKIILIPMSSVHNNRFNILHVLFAYPVFIYQILKHTAKANYVHTRGPSHPALISVLLSFTGRKKYWHKYAGNWMIDKMPVTYTFQRSLLKKLHKQNIAITVNGKDAADHDRIFDFENPSLYQPELAVGRESIQYKSYSGKLNLLFVGALDHNKGILQLLDALGNGIADRIANIYIVGDGRLQKDVQKRATILNDARLHILGMKTRQELDSLYKICHLLIVPSFSEGFPKVIVEAAAYGCITVANNISSIHKYITDSENGFLLKDNQPSTITETLHSIFSIADLKPIAEKASLICQSFTYEHYVQRIKTEIFPTLAG